MVLESHVVNEGFMKFIVLIYNQGFHNIVPLIIWQGCFQFNSIVEAQYHKYDISRYLIHRKPKTTMRVAGRSGKTTLHLVAYALNYLDSFVLDNR